VRHQHEDGENCTNEKPHTLNTSSNIISVIKTRVGWVGHIACMEEMRNAYNILVTKFKGKRPLGRPKHKQQNNVKMVLRGM
jgi:hypothetical protein